MAYEFKISSWADRYRPRKFGDVFGQLGLTESLAACARNANPRPIILSGPTGTGKTTLGLIYAQSIYCEAPEADASPCRQCEECLNFEKGAPGNFHFIQCGSRGGIETIRHILDVQINCSPIYGGRHVVFFDEAHRLSPAAMDALLTPLEFRNYPTAFIFALIDPAALPAALQSRCRDFHVSLPDQSLATEYLRYLCRSEELVFDVEALELIASIKRNFRNLIVNLENVADGDAKRSITLSRVRQVLLYDRSHNTLNYMKALCAADVTTQLSSLRSINQTPTETLSGLRETLLYIKGTYVNRTPFELPNSMAPFASGRYGLSGGN